MVRVVVVGGGVSVFVGVFITGEVVGTNVVVVVVVGMQHSDSEHSS